MANKDLVHVTLKIDRNGQRKMRKLTVAMDKELEFISRRVIELGQLTMRTGPDEMLKTYHRDMREYKLRLEAMMEMTDFKEG